MTRPAESGLPINARSALLAVFVSVIRGGNQVAIKFALTALAPLWTAFARMAISLFAVGLWARWTGREVRATREERVPLALLATIYTVQIGLLHWGADLTSPGYAVVLINTNPIFASLISHFVVVEDRLSARRLTGLAVAFGGVCAVFLGRPDAALAPAPLLGNAIIVLSSAMVGARTVYIQRLVQRMPSSKPIFWQLATAVPSFALGGWLLEGLEPRGPLWGPAAAAIAYQGFVVGGLSLILWVYLLRRHTPGGVSMFSFVTPFAGLLLSAALFDETITPRLLLGLAAVVAGIRLATTPSARLEFDRE